MKKRLIVLTVLIALLVPTLTAQGGGFGASVMEWVRDHVGMEIGSVMIDGTSYSKVVVSPEVRIGRLELGLYLPVIYSSDLFDPSSWYRPKGNNEWDFGAAYWGSDNVKGALDLAADLILKIKYLEYGEPLEDIFFIKLGNLHGLSIGHGLIMRDYRNDSDFPSVRRVGVNTGIDFGGFGFEALVNDLPIPQIYGTRLYFRPFKASKLAIGVSGVADIDAAAELEGTIYDGLAGSFGFLGAGLDLDLPIIKSSPALGLRAFADVAATIPYLGSAVINPDTGLPISEGLKTELLWDGGPHNWGAATGFMGNLAFIDWRLEYRYFTGLFRPAFFDATYERTRSSLVQDYLPYLDGTKQISSDAPTVMGIYGEAGFSLFKDKLSLVAGYMWPWTPKDGFTISADADDELRAGLLLKRGLVPVVDLAGAIYYDKRGIVNSIQTNSFTFFDEKTAFAGEIEIPIPKTPNLAIGLIFKMVAARNPATGQVIYVSDDPTKGVKMEPTVTLETRFRF
ncbi:MAG: hypothetical protein RBT73_04615 [Spirochaetia bacterium]|jgi:hypothetical protein|nr:hypothetical protein [Spirochaetia bacterium]